MEDLRALLSENYSNETSAKIKKRREQHFIVRDLFTCLALCHNVTPTYPDVNDPDRREFQAASPDEIALVRFADEMGYKLIERDQHKIVLYNTIQDVVHVFIALYLFRNLKY